MADPLTIIGGIAAVLQISQTVVNLIKAATDASSDRQKLLAEINATSALCQTLVDYAEIDATPWTTTIHLLCEARNGPVEQLQSSLEFLQKKLSPKYKDDPSRQSKNCHLPIPRRMHIEYWITSLKWPFTRDEVREVIANIERQKSIFSIALTNDNLRLTTVLRDSVGHIGEGVNDIRTNLDSERRQRALARLSTIDFKANHHDISSRRAERTGQWLLNCREFKAWLSSASNTVLWCYGIPGAGKTIMSSLIVDHLRDLRRIDNSMGVAGVYCTYKDPQAMVTIFGSVLQQLTASLDAMPPSLFEDRPPSSQIILEELVKVIASYGQVFLVIDALDECMCKIDLLKELQKLLKLSSTGFLFRKSSADGRLIPAPTVRVIVTSRSGLADIERNLKADIQLEICSKDGDVKTYLQKSLRDHENLSDWIDADPEFEASITEAILPRLSGMFLLARLYVDLLAHIPTKRGVRKALKGLPRSIESTYAEAWDRICAQKPYQAELGRKVISWIVCATRPLRPSELRYGLAVEEGDPDLDEEGLLDIGSLTSYCAGLVVFDKQSNRMSLIHPTASEYFVERQKDLFPMGHDFIAVACTTYLLMSPLRCACLDPDDFNNRYRQHKLLGYAAVNWGYHVRISASKTSLELANCLLQNQNARSAAVQALVLNTSGAPGTYPEWPVLSTAEMEQSYVLYSNMFANSTKPVSALHLAAYFGLPQLVEALAEGQAGLDQVDGMGATAVHWAVLGGQNEMLEHLLDRQANAEVPRQPYTLRRWSSRDGDADFTYPLHMAAALGNIKAIDLLIRHGARIDQLSQPPSIPYHSGDKITPVTSALMNNQIAAAEFLRAQGADVNIHDHCILQWGAFQTSDGLRMLINSGLSMRSLVKVLEYAAFRCRPDILAILLDAGVNANGDPTPDAGSIEYLAAAFQRGEQMNTTAPPMSKSAHTTNLREAAGRVDGDSALRRTPLIQAAQALRGEDRLKCVALLIGAGADVNRIAARTYEYADDWTLCTDENGHDGLIARGTVRKIHSKLMPHGRKTTALHTAAYYKNYRLVRMLIENGADVNLLIDDNITALTSALHSEGYAHPQFQLMEGDVEGERATDGSATITWELTSLRVRAMLELLISFGANPNLCAPDVKARIAQLLSMSSAERESLSALQLVMAEPTWPEPRKTSFWDRKDQLTQLLQKGADPGLCCKRERLRIEEFLAWSDDEIAELDRERLCQLDRKEMDAYIDGLAFRRPSSPEVSGSGESTDSEEGSESKSTTWSK